MPMSRSSLTVTVPRRERRRSASPLAHSKKRVDDAMLMFGVTDNGRMLLLVYEHKPGPVRVYSAREMTVRERTVYHRRAR